MTCHEQGNSYKSISGFLIRNLAGQIGVGRYIQNSERKKKSIPTKNTIPRKTVIQKRKREEAFLRQTKAEEVDYQ